MTEPKPHYQAGGEAEARIFLPWLPGYCDFPGGPSALVPDSLGLPSFPHAIHWLQCLPVSLLGPQPTCRNCRRWRRVPRSCWPGTMHWQHPSRKIHPSECLWSLVRKKRVHWPGIQEKSKGFPSLGSPKKASGTREFLFPQASPLKCTSQYCTTDWNDQDSKDKGTKARAWKD